jgi:TRAP transporter TAXI family solute receptor
VKKALRRAFLAVAIALPVLLALAVGVVAVNHFAGPLPPRTFSISTGREGGAYHQFALEYRRLLARQGFTLVIEPGPGSVETVRRLRQGEVTVGFVQSGTAADADAELVSLASLFYEPLWVFHRRALRVTSLGELRGRRVAAGEQGSGTRELALQLLGASQVTPQNTDVLALTNDDAEARLRDGRIDAALVVISPRAPIVDRLLRHPGVELMSVRRHRAYTSHYGYLTSVTLGEGMIDLARDVPREDKTLLATTAALVARADIHPDLVRVLLAVAHKVHYGGGLFEREGAFPAGTNLQFPLSEDARRYLRDGPPWLERILPFWVAGIVDRLVILLLPVVTVLVPITVVGATLLDRHVRRRIGRWYRTLRDLELRLETLSPDDLDREIERLRALEGQITRRTRLPLEYMKQLYDLKVHIDLIRARLEARCRDGVASSRVTDVAEPTDALARTPRRLAAP